MIDDLLGSISHPGMPVHTVRLRSTMVRRLLMIDPPCARLKTFKDAEQQVALTEARYHTCGVWDTFLAADDDWPCRHRVNFHKEDFLKERLLIIEKAGMCARCVISLVIKRK